MCPCKQIPRVFAIGKISESGHLNENGSACYSRIPRDGGFGDDAL